MLIGVPTEIKAQEFRVGMTPAGVRELKPRAIRFWSSLAQVPRSASRMSCTGPPAQSWWIPQNRCLTMRT